MKKYLSFSAVCLAMVMAIVMLAAGSQARAADKPNILIVWKDDIGYRNISAYNQGMMGYETPNIDRIAKEGILFTHAYERRFPVNSSINNLRIYANHL